MNEVLKPSQWKFVWIDKDGNIKKSYTPNMDYDCHYVPEFIHGDNKIIAQYLNKLDNVLPYLEKLASPFRI